MFLSHGSVTGETSPVKITNKQSAVLLRLKRAIRRGETPLRWIDFFAAETAMQQASARINTKDRAGLAGTDLEEIDLDGMAQTDDALNQYFEVLFDTVLVLSYSTTQGLRAMSARELYANKHLFAFNWQVEEGRFVEILKQFEARFLSAAGDSPLHAVCYRDEKYALRRVFSLNEGVDSWLARQVNEGLMEPSLLGSVAARVRTAMSRLFDFSQLGLGDIDYQAQAVAQSVLSNCLLVSGGPGTGKTTTAARIIITRLLRAMHELEHSQGAFLGAAAGTSELSSVSAFSTVCLAPTGKAAQRLASSLRDQAVSLIQTLDLSAQDKTAIANALPEQGKTIHRYLIENGVPIEDFANEAYIPDNARIFNKGDRRRVLPVVVIVDESSMIDLGLMDRLLSLLSPKSCVVFLGDHHQLPSVELGDVFARWVEKYKNAGFSKAQYDQIQACLPFDCSALTASDDEAHVAINPLVTLRKSYRFSGALAECAAVIRDGSPEQILQWLRTNQQDGVSSRWLKEGAGSDDALVQQLADDYLSYARGLSSDLSLAELQANFDQFQLLCSTRSGPLGAEKLNQQINSKIIDSFPADTVHVSPTGFYHGLPILLERNIAHLDLFNGDVGFFIDHHRGLSAGQAADSNSVSSSYLSADSSTEPAKVAGGGSGSGRELEGPRTQSRFSVAFYRGKDEAPIVVTPRQLPQYELAYAMTIHKSQGSEYDAVSIVVAPYAQELVSRALIYTGLTRAKSRAVLHIAQTSLLALPF